MPQDPRNTDADVTTLLLNPGNGTTEWTLDGALVAVRRTKVIIRSQVEPSFDLHTFQWIEGRLERVGFSTTLKFEAVASVSPTAEFVAARPYGWLRSRQNVIRRLPFHGVSSRLPIRLEPAQFWLAFE